MDDRSLRELEDAQQESAALARRHIETAEEHLHHYRSQLFRIQERFHQHATYRDIAGDPVFRAAFQQVSDVADENIRSASRAILDLEEEYDAMTRRHANEREDFLTRRPRL